ncbi:MAG: fused MFS/spermidine synthase [Bacteroidetes bacterium]|nr:fused MFS/spermidine synthase [Bacteroidota bacterium]
MKENLLKYFSSFLFTHVVEARKSDVSGKIEVLYSNGKYVLDSEHVNYSFGGLHKVFQIVFKRFGIKQRKINNVLILGFGCGSVASILQEEYKKNLEMVGVEKDEAVIELAKKYFFIEKYKHLSLHCEDAYDFVQRCNEKFDLIAMDVFVDIDIPEKFLDEIFLSAVSNLLSDKGILFYNLVIYNEKIRDKGAHLYKQMNRFIGNTEWSRIFAQRTENWVFVSHKLH